MSVKLDIPVEIYIVQNTEEPQNVHFVYRIKNLLKTYSLWQFDFTMNKCLNCYWTAWPINIPIDL